MELETLKSQYKISEEQIKSNMLRPGENAYRTSLKELIGQKYISRNKVFKHFAESLGLDYNGYKKVTSKKLQKAGVDYELYAGDRTIYIDLKSLVGPSYEHIPLEITQSGLFTNHKGKMTDYVLYVVHDDKGARHKWITYDEIVEESLKWKPKLESNGEYSFYKWAAEVKTSNNGSGKYVLVWDI